MELQRNKTVPISGRTHLNMTLNLYQCGNLDMMSKASFPYFDKNAYNMLYMNEGEAHLTTECASTRLAQGQCAFVFPEQEGALVNEGISSCNVTWVSFGGYLVDVYLSRANILVNHPVCPDAEGEIGKMLTALYQRSLKMPNRYCKMMSLLYDVFSYMLDHNPMHKGLEAGYNATYYTLRAIDNIERGMYRSGSVEDLASVLGVTRKHLSAAFQETVGVTPKKYMILFRIEQACRLLRDSDQLIAEIAEAVGYTDQFHFAKEFHRITGMTPTEYRSGKKAYDAMELNKVKETLIRSLSGRTSSFEG